MKELYAMSNPMEKPRLATEDDLRDNLLVRQMISQAAYEEYLAWWTEYSDSGSNLPMTLEEYRESRNLA